MESLITMSGEVDMDKKMVAAELVKVAKDLVAFDEDNFGSDFPYAVIFFKPNRIEFNMVMGLGKPQKSGSQPYLKDPTKAIRYVLDLIEKNGVKPENVEVIA